MSYKQANGKKDWNSIFISLLWKRWEGDEDYLGPNTTVCQAQLALLAEESLGTTYVEEEVRERRERGIILGIEDIQRNSTFTHNVY